MTTSHAHSADGPSDCFGCKLKGVGFWFGSGNGVPMREGKAQFHGRTIAERVRQQKAEAKSNGYDIEPKTRPYAGPLHV